MIVVSGASRGIGYSIAERLHRQGHSVLGVARSPEPSEFETLRVDVSSEDSVKQLVRALRDKRQSIVALINVAGIASMNLAMMAPPKTVRGLVETNLLGTMFMSQALAPLIIRSGGGNIINFSTIAVSLGLEGESAYVASKAGVEAYSRSLARELSAHAIRVNCIAPGPIPTDLLRGVSAKQIDQVVGRQIIRKQFSTDDVCDVVDLLLDPRAQALIGQVFHIGGV